MAHGLTGRVGLAGEGQPAPPPCDESGEPGHYTVHRGIRDRRDRIGTYLVGWLSLPLGARQSAASRPHVSVTALAAV